MLKFASSWLQIDWTSTLVCHLQTRELMQHIIFPCRHVGSSYCHMLSGWLRKDISCLSQKILLWQRRHVVPLRYKRRHGEPYQDSLFATARVAAPECPKKHVPAFLVLLQDLFPQLWKQVQPFHFCGKFLLFSDVKPLVLIHINICLLYTSPSPRD